MPPVVAGCGSSFFNLKFFKKMTLLYQEIHKILSDIPDPEVQIHYSQYKQDENHLAHSAKRTRVEPVFF